MSREAVTGAQHLSDGTGVWRLWELDRLQAGPGPAAGRRRGGLR
ncbi:hypothetical protein [Streptomyces antarcticus]|nr:MULTISPECIES: hypothetical protein [unclassified Streptomyces]MCY0941716.1 hypothetical protein [Streptomyces sp. H34-AA3]MCZ4084345.1 hypothetical protein [Streptomyces sp. H34-S5]